MVRKFIKCFRDRGLKYTMKRTMEYIIKENKINAKLNTYNSKAAYINYIEKNQFNRFNNIRPEFIEMMKDNYDWNPNKPKIIAWYLPQYYQMEVNNKYHGQGFTEWSNTSNTMPQFTGHYQPHIPYDVGYYDLTNVETLNRQAYLAKKYGVYGFCFHWYWFSGERTMEEPPRILLEHPEIDIHYCFNWATENWTSAWDGGTKEVIFEQKIRKNDARKLMNDLLPYFKDKRYIKIENKPVLSIYRCDMFEKNTFKKLIADMKTIAVENGFPGIYFMLTNRVFNGDVKEWGLDALVEFPPCCVYDVCKHSVTLPVYVSPNLKADFFDIAPVVENKLYYKNYGSKEIYRSAMVGFDNTSRRATSGCQIVLNSTPQNFKSWLKGILLESQFSHDDDHNYVFINSWNEWAEGSHLEPDYKYGYAYLQAVSDALQEFNKFDTDYVERKCLHQKNIHFYIHNVESMGDIIASEPIVPYLKQKYSNAKVTWIIKENYADILVNHPLVDNVIKVKCLGESINLIRELSNKKNNIVINCHFDGRMCNKTKKINVNMINADINEKTYLYAGSLLESFCLSAGLPQLDDTPRVYFDSKNINIKLPSKYVVIHCSSAEKTKDWRADKWQKIVDILIQNGYFVVEIGLIPVIKCNSSKYIDCTNVNKLQDVFYIISEATLFIGVDSGFAHVANALDIPGVLIFGKYKNFYKPMPYSGNYKHGKNVKILYADSGNAENVSVEDVMLAYKELL